MTDNNHLNIDYYLFKKMCFIYNALENGWSIQKKGDAYCLIKKHGGKKEIFTDDYLSRYINEYLKTPIIKNNTT